MVFCQASTHQRFGDTAVLTSIASTGAQQLPALPLACLMAARPGPALSVETTPQVYGGVGKLGAFCLCQGALLILLPQAFYATLLGRRKLETLAQLSCRAFQVWSLRVDLLSRQRLLLV